MHGQGAFTTTSARNKPASIPYMHKTHGTDRARKASLLPTGPTGIFPTADLTGIAASVHPGPRRGASVLCRSRLSHQDSAWPEQT